MTGFSRPIFWLHQFTLLVAASFFAAGLGVDAADATPVILPNGAFELDADADQWPDGWPRLDAASWELEGENRFIRLRSQKPNSMVMLYRELPVPAGVQAIEMRWKQRVSDLAIGKDPWNDARIMLEFMDAGRNKVAPTPSVPYSQRNTDGWVERSTAFLVPDGATTLKFMPCLFQVRAGTYDLDDIQLLPTDPAPVRAALEARRAAYEAKIDAQAAKSRARAAERLAASGSLIANGDLETDANADGWPDDWAKGLSVTWESSAATPAQAGDAGAIAVDPTIGDLTLEQPNHFIRLSAQPGKLVMLYQTYALPADVPALKLSWKHRVTGLKKGEKPWFDARFLFQFQDKYGKKIGGAPGPSYSQRDTDGWVEKSVDFLLPEEAVTLVIMPSMFEAQAGTLDIDDISLTPTDPAPILARVAERERREAARYVAPEEPNKANWPKMLKVVGNRLHDSDGNEVWLQGVNAGGLETLPHDQQVVKSLVVAIDEWQANCVRVPIKEEFWWGDSWYQKDGGKAYRETIDKMITLAANRGAYVVIDLHRYRAPKQIHADFWQEFATVYKDHPAVLFDLFNEPHGISWEIWRNGGWVGTKKGVDESAFLTDEEKTKNQGFESIGMQGLVDAVRSTGARNIVIAGGVFWCNDLSGIVNGYALDDKDGNGVMYSWHTYNWHTGWAEKVLPTAEKYPIFLGEVGADTEKMGFIPEDIQEDPHTFVPDMLGFIQKYRINWTGWCFHPRATPRLLLDWDYTPTPFWGVYAKDALAGKQFEMKRMR